MWLYQLLNARFILSSIPGRIKLFWEFPWISHLIRTGTLVWYFLIFRKVFRNIRFTSIFKKEEKTIKFDFDGIAKDGEG